MAPRRFKTGASRRRQIKGSIGGGGPKGDLSRKAPGGGGGGGGGSSAGGGGGGGGGGIVDGRNPLDPTQWRTAGGAFTTYGWVNVPGGKVWVAPGDSMSEAIGQGKGLISMARTEQTRSASGAYTQGGYVRTGQGGNASVTRVRAGDTRSEVVGAARAASRTTGRDTRSERSGFIRGLETQAARRAAGQGTVRMNQAAGERTGVGVRASAPASRTRSTSVTRGAVTGPAPAVRRTAAATTTRRVTPTPARRGTTSTTRRAI